MESLAESTVVDDCRGVLKIYSDGTLVRSKQPCFAQSLEDDGRVLSKDVEFEPRLGLELRIYLPSDAAENLPVFVYFHGGGFCIGSRTWPNFHNYCLRLAAALGAVVLAPDYRLAPEDRLPAALDDGFSALRWIRTQSLGENADPWMAHADFSRVYVAGDSAGGNIAHHVALGFQREDLSPVALGFQREDLSPVVIRGFVLLMPAFSGEARTPSEATCPDDAFLNLALSDSYWRLSLPVGSNRDHPFSNPFGPEAPSLQDAVLAPLLVVAGGRDLLRDREIQYAESLKKYGKTVELLVFEEEQHEFFTITPYSEPSRRLMERIVRFVGSDAQVEP